MKKMQPNINIFKGKDNWLEDPLWQDNKKCEVM